jgi:hypothetical protein
MLTERTPRPASFGADQTVARLAPAGGTAPTAQEALYLDIEMALARHGTPELRALDDLTPRALDESPPSR